MSYTINKTISVDFPNGFSASQLLSEITLDPAIIIEIECIKYLNDTVSICFVSQPPQIELDILDALIAIHVPVIVENHLNMTGLDITNVDDISANDVFTDTLAPKSGSVITVSGNLDITGYSLIGLDLGSHEITDDFDAIVSLTESIKSDFDTHIVDHDAHIIDHDTHIATYDAHVLDHDSHVANITNPHNITLEQARSAGNVLSGDIDLSGFDIIGASSTTTTTINTNLEYITDLTEVVINQDGMGAFFKKPGDENAYWVGDLNGDERSLSSFNGYEGDNDATTVDISTTEFTVAKSYPVAIKDVGTYILHWSAEISGSSVVEIATLNISLSISGVIGEASITPNIIGNFHAVSGFHILDVYAGGENLEFQLKTSNDTTSAEIRRTNFYIVRAD